MQKEIHTVTTTETNKVLPCRLLTKGETTSGVIIDKKTNYVTYRIRNVGKDELQEDEIHKIVYACRETAI